MKRDPRKLVWDAREAVDAIASFTGGKSAADYAESDLLRSAVERQFEIIGEALARLARADAAMAAQIPTLRSIIGFRNILIHGYATVNDDMVWRTIQEDLPPLRAVLDALLLGMHGEEPG
jgi:uncharacterized protein with HEPN domain